MLDNLYKYCESPSDFHWDVRNKATAYEYLIKRLFEVYFNNKDSFSINLFPIYEILTPDMELSTTINGHKIVIPIEIKYFDILSVNKKNARKDTRRQMDKYREAYRKNYSNETIIMPLVIAQNSYFDENQGLRDEYPCIILSLRDIKEVEFDLESIIREKIVKYVKYISEHSSL
jgi:hypothetical protein